MSRIESISSFWTGDGSSIGSRHPRHHLVFGTADGLVVPLDCHQKSASITPGTRAFECTAPIGSAKTIHNKSKDRRPVNVVQVAESWGAFICIIEGMITAYDLVTYELICQIEETKGNPPPSLALSLPCSLSSLHAPVLDDSPHTYPPVCTPIRMHQFLRS